MGGGETNQASETYIRVTKLHPENPLPFMRLAEIGASRKTYAAAIDYLKAASAAVPDSPTVIILLATAYREAGRIDAGLAEARRLEKEKPKYAGGYTLEAEL